jgi:JmjC domain, hydroxylase
MALKSIQEDNYSGSTRLHCDLCDAINIMVFSSLPTGTALWHIFQAADSDKIRAYIKKFHGCTLDDPIHSQHYYLGPSDLERMKRLYGVVPYTIHQKVGEAVFIPAGCAHQVNSHFTS